MTAGSRRVHAIQAHYKRKMVLFINLLGKGFIQKINRDGGSIRWAPALSISLYILFENKPTMRPRQTNSISKSSRKMALNLLKVECIKFIMQRNLPVQSPGW